jgi:O6-methylguanine-DNA--protein-cysteine methyltransferase
MASSTLPFLDDVSLTPFRKRVYTVVHKIQKGYVRSYGSIAKELSTSARAVGTAMGANPFGPCDDVP